MSDSLKARYPEALMNTFGPPKLALVRGEGTHVWDEDGKEYVDLLAGIAVNSLGHGHPALVGAVSAQLRTRRSNWPSGCSPSSAVTRARSSSPTPAPRPTRVPSSSPVAPVAPTWSWPRAGSTGAPWARSH